MRTLAALLLLLLVVVCIIGSSNAACGPLGSIAGGVPCRRYVEAVSERSPMIDDPSSTAMQCLHFVLFVFLLVAFVSDFIAADDDPCGPLGGILGGLCVNFKQAIVPTEVRHR
ncbi:hypothetical protein QR680_009922 [Steinernema hermaphroditum]|uniref:Saposin B-type domain-containing protein n=1 Tax=Steinernema hermaphroditum TaxID=289476 RepID=A0AA39IM50_9BILA|nr:hypothetical protein QR680_009922 [Steinernema hermaphroditum]